MLDPHDAILTNEGGNALSLNATEIKGAALLNDMTATGGVEALRAIIEGELGLQDTAIINEGGNALNLDGAGVKGDAFLRNLTATGLVRAHGLAIGGQPRFAGCHIH